MTFLSCTFKNRVILLNTAAQITVKPIVWLLYLYDQRERESSEYLTRVVGLSLSD